MPLPRRRSSFLGQQPPSSAAESTGPPGRRVSVGGGGSLSRPPGVYVGTVPTGGVSSLGTRVSRRALGISSVFLQGLRSSSAALPLAPGLEKGRGLTYESLNGCLVEYIEKVRALEQVNQELEEHIRVYLDKKAASVGTWGALRENWEAIYHQVRGRAPPAAAGGGGAPRAPSTPEPLGWLLPMGAGGFQGAGGFKSVLLIIGVTPSQRAAGRACQAAGLPPAPCAWGRLRCTPRGRGRDWFNGGGGVFS